MAINLKGATYRNAQEQILENANNIEDLQDELGSNSTPGSVKGRIKSLEEDMPLKANVIGDDNEFQVKNTFTKETTFSDDVLFEYKAGFFNPSDIQFEETPNLATLLDNKQDTLIFDDGPVEDSDNPVKSGGIYTALASKQNNLEFNPTVPSGTTPTPLANLRDGEDYYSLGGGNESHVYMIAFMKSGSPNYYISLIVSSSVNLTDQEITNLSNANVYNALTALEIPNNYSFMCTGYASSTTSFYYGTMDTQNGVAKFYHGNSNVNSLSTYITSIAKLF